MACDTWYIGPHHPTVDMMLVLRRLHELARKDTPWYLFFIDLTTAYESVDGTLLWGVLARFGVPPRMLAAIRQFHDGMQACVRLDDGECSDKFDVGQCLRQGLILRPPSPTPAIFFNERFMVMVMVMVMVHGHGHGHGHGSWLLDTRKGAIKK